MSKMLYLEKFKYNKEKNEETISPLNIYEKDIICLYRDRRGVFIITRQSFMHKVPYSIRHLTKLLEL